MNHEIPQFIDINEVGEFPPVQILWSHLNDGSLYAGERISEGSILIAGSTWDRKRIPYSRERIRNTPGVMHSLITDQSEVCALKERSILFPSMVNAIVIAENNVIICCNHEINTFNRLSLNLDISKSVNDPVGLGVYTALYDRQRNNIVAASRSGCLSVVALDTFRIVRSLSLTPDGCRLWSVRQITPGGMIVAGDYNGRLYLVPDYFGNCFFSLDITEVSNMVSQEKRNRKPSIFGLAVLSESEIVAGLRWGQIIWLKIEKDKLSVGKAFVLPMEISYIETVKSSGDLLIGTREGKLLYLEVLEDKIRVLELLSSSPSCQQDNAIWSISPGMGREYVVTFADGQAVGIALNNKL